MVGSRGAAVGESAAAGVNNQHSQDGVISLYEVFRQTLRELGYVEGKNIQFEYRYIEGQQDKIPGLVAELVQFTSMFLSLQLYHRSARLGRPRRQSLMSMVTTNDPLATEIVNSLARPGGNITGFTRLIRNPAGKRLELLEEVVAKLSRVGVLWDANEPGPTIAFKEYEAAAQLLRIKLQSLEIWLEP